VLADIEPVYRAPAIDTLATVRKRGLLRVGVVNVEPMVMRDARGELVGYSVDLARRLAQDIGVELEFVPTSWSHVLPDLLARQFDLVATGLWVTVPRALVVNFSDATAVEGVQLVAGKGRAAGLAAVADFDRPGVTLAVVAGSPQVALATRLFPRATLLPVDDDVLTPVLQGRALAALVPTLAPQALVRAAPDRLVLPLAKPLASASAAIAVRKGDPELLGFLNTWLALQRESGWLDERLLHWSTSTDWLK
jgi:polar amino acid transport system substrate-binding protein